MAETHEYHVDLQTSVLFMDQAERVALRRLEDRFEKVARPLEPHLWCFEARNEDDLRKKIARAGKLAKLERPNMFTFRVHEARPCSDVVL